jgi:type I restriction enzyme S subunit
MWQGRSALSQLEGIVSPAYTIVRPNSNANSLFFSYLLKLDEIIFKFYRNSQGMVSDTWMCKFKDFSKVRFFAPPTKKEQDDIAEIIENASEEIKIQEQKLATLQKQKKGLMQQLLTGQKRVM